MRLVIADCSIDYAGRLQAHLPPARRLIVVKADGTVVVHGDKGHKALNWMAPPCSIVEHAGGWTVTGARGEVLEIAIEAIHSDTTVDLGAEPGLRKTHSEAELQVLLAAVPDAVEPGAVLIRREHATDVGPVDMLLRAADGSTLVVEVKRVAELAAVEQLSRYLECLAPDGTLQPMRGILAAQTVKPQTRALASQRGIACIEIDFDLLAGRIEPDLTLF